MNVTLSDSTKIPLKTVLPVVGVVLAAAFWITNAINGVSVEQRIAAERQANVAEDVSELKLSVQELRLMVINDKWTHSDMTRWARELKASNPNVVVPEPN